MAGGVTVFSGWNDQNSRCFSVIVPVFAVAEAMRRRGHCRATARPSSPIPPAWRLVGLQLAAFGHLQVPVCRTAWISRLLSGSPGMTAAPRLPPFSNAAFESTRSPPFAVSSWQS